MKSILAIICFFISVLSASPIGAQSNKVPPFKIVKANGKPFKAYELPMGKPIVLIYFSPECDHCEKLTQEMVKQMPALKKASIAMITYLPIDKVGKFVQKFNLNKYPNLYVGTEENNLVVRNYYNIYQLPFMALYTKNGDLVKAYKNEEQFPDLVKNLTALK